ncbi:MAG: hypothetical protein P8046_00765, partial [Anaerolineales bacterium]
MTEEKPERIHNPEPTVLDYFLAKIMPWRGPAPEIPPLPEEDAEPVISSAYEAPDASPVTLTDSLFRTLPWRAIASLLLALIGQFLLMPPRRMGMVGGFFYMLAVGMLVWGIFHKDLSLAAPEEHEPAHDSFKVAITPLLIGIAISVLAFFTFSQDPITGEQLYSDL